MSFGGVAHLVGRQPRAAVTSVRASFGVRVMRCHLSEEEGAINKTKCTYCVYTKHSFLSQDREIRYLER